MIRDTACLGKDERWLLWATSFSSVGLMESKCIPLERASLARPELQLLRGGCCAACSGLVQASYGSVYNSMF